MKILGVILREMRYRLASTLLATAVVAVAVAVVHFFVLTARAVEQETRVIQRDLGLNLVILPKDADLDRYWSQGEGGATMPAPDPALLAQQDVANRLIPMLRRRVEVDGTQVMLTGIGSEVFRRDQRKREVFGMNIPHGHVVIGNAAAAAMAVRAGGVIELLQHPFTVDQVLPLAGSAEDLRVYASLAQVQEVLGLPGRLSEIQALECHCAEDVEDPLALIQGTLSSLLPQTQVIRRRDQADARRHQRQMADRLLAVAVPVVVLLCALCLAAITALNVRDRRREIGVFQALGFRARAIAVVFLGRAMILGAIGALGGGLAGWILARWMGAQVFRFPGAVLDLDAALLLHTLWMAPLLSAACAMLPSSLAATRDPASCLRSA